MSVYVGMFDPYNHIHLWILDDSPTHVLPGVCLPELCRLRYLLRLISVVTWLQDCLAHGLHGLHSCHNNGDGWLVVSGRWVQKCNGKFLASHMYIVCVIIDDHTDHRCIHTSLHLRRWFHCNCLFIRRSRK